MTSVTWKLYLTTNKSSFLKERVTHIFINSREYLLFQKVIAAVYTYSNNKDDLK